MKKNIFRDLCTNLKNFSFNAIFSASQKQKIFVISQENIELAIAEILSLTGCEKYSIDYKNVLVNTRKKVKDLAYTRKIISDGKIEWINEEKFESRKAHKRPAMHPSSLHPKLARCMVNLANKKTILDPFCGSGGILVEAGLMGRNIIGSDIDKRMIERCKVNLKHFKLKGKIEKKDARTITGRYACIVTDPPYGRNTRTEDVRKLYSSFLKNALKVTGKIVIGFPDFIDVKINKEWKLTGKYEYYIHKSLKKIIVVLEKR